ncbi:MAG: tripartite tricarboxylate transporter substrate binding protein [Betaproteobacteria bacterium]|nr:tripartite tricarboxylate transporter substrate binding protein [Betaproteobacteria bacterium]
MPSIARSSIASGRVSPGVSTLSGRLASRVASRLASAAIALCAACAVALAAITPAAAQYPSRPIRLLVPIPPGGGPDIVARLIAPKLAEALGEPVLVENRVGGNGSVAGEAVARAAPDGYTLLLGMDSLLAINPHLYGKMPFDPLKDLTPVASLVSNGFFLAVNPSLPARTLQEFIEYARRANPPLQYASGGNGSQHHLTMERLKARAGISLVHIPYKGGAPATTATVAGEVSAMMSGTSTAGQIKAGRLRAIAFTGPARSPVMPEVPTIAELYPDFVMVQWYGLFAPAGVPAAVLARLRAEVNKALAQPDVRDRLRSAGGVETWITTPEEFAAGIRNDYARYAKLVKDIGAKVD